MLTMQNEPRDLARQTLQSTNLAALLLAESFADDGRQSPLIGTGDILSALWHDSLICMTLYTGCDPLRIFLTYQVRDLSTC